MLHAKLRKLSSLSPTHLCWGQARGLESGVQGLGFRVWGQGFRVLGLESGDQGLGFRVRGSGFRDQGLGFRVQISGAGFRVEGLGKEHPQPFTKPPRRQPRGKFQVNLPQMPPESGGVCMGVDLRNHRFALGLPPGWLGGRTFAPH